jgi:hypothetical protein
MFRNKKKYEFDNATVLIGPEDGDRDGYWYCNVVFYIDEPTGRSARGISIRDSQYEGTIEFTHPFPKQAYEDDTGPTPVDISVEGDCKTLKIDDAFFSGAPEREIDFIARDYEVTIHPDD